MFKISEVAQQTGLSIDSIRHYERIGLLRRLERSESSHRFYVQADVNRLNLIRTSRFIGMTLEEIRAMLNCFDNPDSCNDESRQMLARHQNALVHTLSELTSLQQHLQTLAQR